MYKITVYTCRLQHVSQHEVYVISLRDFALHVWDATSSMQRQGCWCDQSNGDSSVGIHQATVIYCTLVAQTYPGWFQGHTHIRSIHRYGIKFNYSPAVLMASDRAWRDTDRIYRREKDVSRRRMRKIECEKKSDRNCATWELCLSLFDFFFF